MNVSHCAVRRSFAGGVFSYWTMSGRIGALKTLGSGWVSLEAAPSAPWMVTVGRLAILSSLCREVVWSRGRCNELVTVNLQVRPRPKSSWVRADGPKREILAE